MHEVIQKQRQDDNKTASLLEEKLSHRQKVAAEKVASCISKQIQHLSKVNQKKISYGIAAIKRRDDEAKILDISIGKKLDAAASNREKILTNVTERLSQNSLRKVKRAQIVEKKWKVRGEIVDKATVLRIVEAENRRERLQYEQITKLAEQTQKKLERGAKALKKPKTRQLSAIEAKLTDAQKRRDQMHADIVKKISEHTNLKRLSGVGAMKLAEMKSEKLNETLNAKLETSAKRKKYAILSRVQTIATLTASKAQRSKHVLAYQYFERVFLDWKIESKLYEAAVRKESLLIELSAKLSDERKRKSNQYIQAQERYDASVKMLQCTATKRISAATERKRNLEMAQLAKISRSVKMKRNRVIRVQKHTRSASNNLELYINYKVHSATMRREKGLRARVRQVSHHNCKKLGTCHSVKKTAEKMSRELRESVEAKLVKAAERKEKFLEGIVGKVATMNQRRVSPTSSISYLTPRSPAAVLALATLEQRLSDASARRKSLLAQRAERAQLKNRRRNETASSSSNATLPPQCVEPSVASCSISDSNNTKVPSSCSDFSESHPKKLFADTPFGLSISSILTHNPEAIMVPLNGNEPQQRNSMLIKSGSDEEDPISPLPSPVSWGPNGGYLCSIM